MLFTYICCNLRPHLKPIFRFSPQTVDRFLYRSLAHGNKSGESNAKTSSSSSESSKGETIEDDGVKTVVETSAARRAREKAEWERLSFVERIIKKFMPSHINSIFILVLAGLGYVAYEQVKNDHEIKETFRTGSCPKFKFKEDQLLERNSMFDTLVSILTPVADKLVSSYYIILGEHGTGKSTLIRTAAREVGQGVIYVEVPSSVEKFGFAFARAIRFNFKEHIRLSTWIESKMFGAPPDDGKQASWERVLITFQKYAIKFKKQYGRVPVLIIDNCDLLAHKDPKMLEILQEAAKTAIDDSTWITVFVSSVGHAPEQMEARSSITRASSFIEISDLSKEETMTYLTKRRHLEDKQAEQLYSLFGGRIKNLQNAVTKMESGMPFSSIRKTTLQDIARKIEKIRCRTATNEQEFIFKVLCALVDKSELTVDDLIALEEDVNVRMKILDELRNETILVRTVATGSYAFQSQSIKVSIEEYYKDKKCKPCRKNRWF